VSARTCLSIVLAAGEGTRMRSSRPKVLHGIGGSSMLAHVLHAVHGSGATQIAVVMGPDADAVRTETARVVPNAEVFVQTERRGTAHAALSARGALARGFDDVVVVFGDTPLLGSGTLAALRATLAAGAGVAVLGFRPVSPSGYGRLIVQGGALVDIREEKDASEAERALGLCNGGVMALRGDAALRILEQIDDRNAKHEFYLTDAVKIAVGMGLPAVALETEEDEVRGINTKAQLADAEAVLQRRLRAAALDAGVTLVAPETVFLSADTKFGRDVVIEPNVVFGPGVVVEDEAVIHAFSHLEGAHVGKGASVGPFARLRPGTKLGPKVRIGNFVETKAADIEAGAKANHLAYIGDARVGEGANVGAGTIVCNYDGVAKHHTDIGKGAFIGSNSSLVAPVKIGDGAYVGTGSVVTDEVPADALAIARGRQVNKPQRAAELRARQTAAKASGKASQPKLTPAR
jgi:bifunctional UDP-N-acetylglucosamine pyrophosphorylase/glucosamine-1-phosphate N-acetyltransferase